MILPTRSLTPTSTDTGFLIDRSWVRTPAGLSTSPSPTALDDIIADQALVAAGLGVTTMPGLALRSYQAAGVRASELTRSWRRVYIAAFGEPPDPPATTAFVTALRNAADASALPPLTDSDNRRQPTKSSSQ